MERRKISLMMEVDLEVCVEDGDDEERKTTALLFFMRWMCCE